jgi:hypothetical protein
MFPTLFSNVLGFFTGGWKWLVAIVVVAGLAFTAGFYNGSTHEAKIMAQAATQAAQIAQQAQAKYDAAQWAKAKADTDKRAAEQQASNDALKKLLAGVKGHVLTPSKCLPQELPKVTADAMHLLNDPALVGATQ